MTPYLDLSEFGKIIAEARKARGLTQAELARAAGLSRVTLGQLERGSLKDLGVRKLIRLAGLLGLALGLGPEGPMPTLEDLQRENLHD